MDLAKQNQRHNMMLEQVTEEMNDGLREGEYLEIIRKLKLSLADKSDECELLKIKLRENEQEIQHLADELYECKLTIFENNEDSQKNHEEVMKSKKLEEDYVKLMSDFLALGEKSDQYKENLVDNYLARSNAINSFECQMSSGAFLKELEDCKSESERKSADLSLALAKLKNSEEENATKDKSLAEIKKAFEDAKVTHKHEVTVLEEYTQCLKNTITSYEKTLASYIEPKSQENLATPEQ